jgi:nicotinamidase-related amidase
MGQTFPVSALLVIDAQVGLLDGPDAVPGAARAVRRIAEVLAAARRDSASVIHLQHDGVAGAPDEPGTSGWRIHPLAAPLETELVLRKHGDDGFEGTQLEEVLRDRRVRRLAVVGFLSEMCVSATIRGALARELEVVLVRGAHATFDIDEIPASVVSRVAEHALGDKLEICDVDEVRFSG